MTDKTKILLAVIVLAAAGAVVYLTLDREEPIELDFVYKCTECGRVIDLTKDQVAAEMARLRDMYPEITPMALKIECPDCKKPSCSYALRCAECGEVFIYDPKSPHPEKCPKCGYDPQEQRE
jgi:DNA-directed RNA polymerase subunit RPC12/RpoP